MGKREDELDGHVEPRPLAEAVTKAIEMVYESYRQLPAWRRSGFDRDVRHPIWTRRILNQLGKPDVEAYNVTVTGSKGKGSHSILIAAILQQAGYRVGLFTSPHLVDFLERIRVDGMRIPDADFVRLSRVVREVTAALPMPEDEYVGPVGIIAVIAALYFRERQTDVNVYELGRGARFDDVNQIRHQGAVVTPIFPEHLDKLGPVWHDVVHEKMGILTEDTSWMVSYEQTPEVFASMAKKKLPLHTHWFGRNVSYTVDTHAGEGSVVTTSLHGIAHRAKIGESLLPFSSNVAVALVASACAAMDRDGRTRALNVDLRQLSMPGRLQVVATRPTVIVDGAIHFANARFIANWLQTYHTVGRVYALISLPDDKDLNGLLTVLGPLIDDLTFTTTSNEHLAFTRDLQPFAKWIDGRVDWIRDVECAISHVMSRAKRDDVVLCVGTQSFVGDVLRHFDVSTESIWSEK